MSVQTRKTRSVLDQCRRFALSVIVDDTPGVAKRLAGMLEWRGFRFDRIVVSDSGNGDAGTRLLLVTTVTEEGAGALQDIIQSYGPVKALSVLYAAPVISEEVAA